jgi:uncharacterized protein
MTSSVPAFPEFRKIELSDKELFRVSFSKYPEKPSELTFTNFFIWRDCDNTKITSINGNICVTAKHEDDPPYFFEPLGDNDIDKTISTCLSYIPRFNMVSEKFMKDNFEDKTGYRIVPDRDHFDYVYRTDELIALKGKKYDGKRNKIKRFLKNNIPIYLELSEELVPDCMELLDKWIINKTPSKCLDEPIREMLKNISVLDVEGAAIKINGKVKAFSIGEALNDDTAIIYIEVADPDIDGLAQFINQQFCKNAWSRFTYVNREQDLGDAGLRRAKLSYHPVKLINKFDITLA